MIRISQSEIIQLIPVITTRTTSINRSDTIQYRPSDNVVSLSFKNVGVVDATLNGAQLKAGDPMYSISVSDLSILEGQYSIVFGPGAGVKNIEIVLASRTGFKQVRTPINIIEKI